MLKSTLAQYREHFTFQRDAGDAFERLALAFFKLEPQYVELFSDVWLWKDWPQREDLGYQARDTGIDLVAMLRDGSGFAAIQCKFYESTIALPDLGSFFTLSGKGAFTQRFIVATAPLNDNARDAIEDQAVPVQLISLENLEESSIDWSQFSIQEPSKLRKFPPKQPRKHQERAIADVHAGFQEHDRGKLIMACGTGKTLTSLEIAQREVGPGGTVLFLMPSIALLSQTLRAWTADAKIPLRCYAVCSDSKASRNEEDIRIYELAYPATTNADKLAASLESTQDPAKMTVIFSTYQSIDVVHRALESAGVTLDLAICDEGHRTAGYTPPGEDHSVFVRIHDADYIRARKRLYMTATPRIYAEASKAKAGESGVQVFDMNDEAVYGPVFHRLRFDQAVQMGLLSDYKVLVIAVDELHVSQALNKRISDEGDELKLDDAVKIIGCWNALAKNVSEDDGMDVAADPQPMRTAIAFAQSIKHSKRLAAEFEQISQDLADDLEHLPALEARHVDGTMNVVKRNQMLAWLKDNIGSDESVCRILTNARCLSEGIDVPALDAAIFLNPRDSVVDVVQSVGRVMRKATDQGKKYGYVILPIGIRKDSSPEQALDDNKKYRVVWQVLNALRAHDERLDRQFATIDLTGDRNGVVNVIGVGGGKDKTDNLTQQLTLGLSAAELGHWQDALFAKIVHKCGNRRYWEDWAKDIAQIADRHQMRIKALLESPHGKATKAFNKFLKDLRRNLNPSISQDDAVEMLAQHVITRPVFDALFEGYAFTSSNPVSQSMQQIQDILDSQALDKEHEVLEGFYASVRERARGISDPAGRQKIILELYDKFFKTAFPRMVQKLGIVYTPVPIVDFIIRSANEALQEHFDASLADENVHILDPFTGTGTFPVRMIESGLIPKDKLAHKYRHELHANEIVLLAYYIAAVNIEEAFHRVSGQDYEPFPGIVLTDTFQLNEWDDQLDVGIPENSERADRQKAQDIRVIVGNPPYSVGQDDANDNNKNGDYPVLDAAISRTYARHSTAVNKNSLYDSYIRAFRWASDRIKDQGIVCFVTNGGWIDGNTMDGFRKTLVDEFSHIYVFNLRGNQRTTVGELSRKEGGKIFDSGSRTPVAITLLVKRSGHQGPASIHYEEVADYLTRDDKLQLVSTFGSFNAVPHKPLTPNEHHDWINQRSLNFGSLVPLNDAPDAIFALRSNGVQTNRDAWAFNFSREAVASNMERMIAFYNAQLAQHGSAIRSAGDRREQERVAQQLIDGDGKRIKWSGSLITELVRGKAGEFDESRITTALYRPFQRTHVYYDRQFNHRYKEKFYPTAAHSNLAIMVTGTGTPLEFTALVTNILPDLQGPAKCQCFPMHWYEKAGDTNAQGGLGLDGDGSNAPDEHGYIKRDGVTDVALANFRAHYNDPGITKEAIFYYVYGVLHSPEYRAQYASDLKKVLPRVPMSDEFRAFEAAGRELAELHLNYETVEPWELEEKRKPQGEMADLDYYRVEKLRFASAGGRAKDKSTIVYNSRITLTGIPLEAYDYMVNGKSAIDWVLDRYRVSTDKDSKILNDPNAWSREHNDPVYIYNLIRRVVRVSMETIRIVGLLPKL